MEKVRARLPWRGWGPCIFPLGNPLSLEALQLRLDEGQNIRVRRNAGAEGIWVKLDPRTKAVLHHVGDPGWAVATVQLNAVQHEQPPRLLLGQEWGLVDHGSPLRFGLQPRRFAAQVV